MSDELIKELSRLQLLSSRYKDKMRMCPLHTTREENRAYLIFHYIKQLKQENQKYKEVFDKVINILEENDTEYTTIDVEELIYMLKEVNK